MASYPLWNPLRSKNEEQRQRRRNESPAMAVRQRRRCLPKVYRPRPGLGGGVVGGVGNRSGDRRRRGWRSRGSFPVSGAGVVVAPAQMLRIR